MKLFLLFVFFTALSLSFSSDSPSYRIDLKWQDQNNTITLSKGKFEPITIEIHSIPGTPLLKHETPTLTLSDKTRFIMPYEQYEIDTNEFLAIRTFIGVDCNAEISEDELVNGIAIQFEVNNPSFETQVITVMVSNNQNEIYLNNTDTSIGPRTYGLITLLSSSMNVNPITINFEFTNAEQYWDTIMHLDTNELTLDPSVDAYIYLKQYVKYFADEDSVTSDVQGVQIKATIVNNNCYIIHPESEIVTIDIIHEQTVSNVNDNKVTVSWLIENNSSIYFFSIDNSNVASGMVSCTIVSQDLDMISDDDIISQTYPNDPLYQDKVFLLQAFIGNKQRYFGVYLTTINKYLQYQWKCIHENNAYKPEHKQSSAQTSDIPINVFISNVAGFPTCYNAFFTKLPSVALFDEKIRQYISYAVFEDSRDNYSQDGCIRVYNRDVSEYYPQEIERGMILQSYCFYSDPKCNITSYDAGNVKDTIHRTLMQTLYDANSIETTLGLTNIGVSDIYQSNYFFMNSTMIIVSKNILHNSTEYITQLNTLNNEPIECYYDVIDSSVSKNTTFQYNEDQRIIIQSQNKEGNILHINFTDYDNKIHAIKFACTTLPGWKLFDRMDKSFLGFYLFHSKDLEYDCTTDIKSPLCISTKYSIQVYDDLKASVEGITNVINDVKTFKTKTFSDKQKSLNNVFTKMEERTQHHLIYPYTIKADDYMAFMNCIDSDNYVECKDTKRNKTTIAMNKVESLIYNDTVKNITAYIQGFDKSYARHIYEHLLIKAITLGNNADSLDKNTSRTALKFITALGKESESLIDTIKEMYSQSDKKYLQFIEDITTLNIRALYSLQTVIGYMDVQDFFEKKSTNESYNVIIDDDVVNYLNVMSLRLSSMFVSVGINNTETDYFIYKYKSLVSNRNSNINADLFEINEIVKADIPQSELVAKNITGLTFITYKIYPMISVRTNSTVFGSVVVNINTVTSNGVSKEKRMKLEKPIELIYDLKKLGINVTHCYLVENGTLFENGTKVVNYNQQEGTVSCEVSLTGDVIVLSVAEEVEEEPKSQLTAMEIIIIIIAVFLLATCVLCCSVRKKKKYKSENIGKEDALVSGELYQG